MASQVTVNYMVHAALHLSGVHSVHERRKLEVQRLVQWETIIPRDTKGELSSYYSCVYTKCSLKFMRKDLRSANSGIYLKCEETSSWFVLKQEVQPSAKFQPHFQVIGKIIAHFRHQNPQIAIKNSSF